MALLAQTQTFLKHLQCNVYLAQVTAFPYKRGELLTYWKPQEIITVFRQSTFLNYGFESSNHDLNGKMTASLSNFKHANSLHLFSAKCGQNSFCRKLKSPLNTEFFPSDTRSNFGLPGKGVKSGVQGGQQQHPQVFCFWAKIFSITEKKLFVSKL